MQMARKKRKAVIDLESSEECDAGKFDGLYDSESDLHIDVDNLSDVCYFFIFRFKYFATMFYFLYNFYILFCMMVITFLLCLFWICLYFVVYSIHILLMMIVSNVLLINNFLRRYNMHSSSMSIFNFLFKLSYCFNLFFYQFL